ncbi:hypothetical protein RhiTH_011746 [Rhizoctonia solani]
MCTPGVCLIPATSTHLAYPPAGLASLVASHQGLPHGGLTAPIKCRDKVTNWKVRQRSKERANIAIKDRDLGAEERAEMEKKIFLMQFQNEN